MSVQSPDDALCTAGVNPLWPHRYDRYDRDPAVTANPAMTPGYDTCGRTETGHTEYTPERIRSAEWGQVCYQRAAENAVHKNIPMHMGHAEQELVDEAHADALHVDAARGRVRWDNDRRAQLTREAHEGRNSTDSLTRGKWLARDEASTRPFAAPAHDPDEF